MASITAVDGRDVDITASGSLNVKSTEATMFGVWTGELGRHELAVGNLGFGADTGAREGIGLDEKYTLGGGEVVHVGHRVANDHVTKLDSTTVLGVWMGVRHTVRLWIQGADPVRALTTRMLAVFDELDLSEVESGVVITSKDDRTLALERGGTRAPDVVCYIGGLGLLSTIERTPEQEWQVPDALGAPAVGGQLWTEANEPASDQNDPILVFRLVGDTAISRIVAETASHSEAALVSRAFLVSADWQARL